jgi:hypothetical protein
MRRERIGRAHQRGSGRRGHGQAPAGPQHAADLRQQQLHVAHVLDRLGAEHEVETGIAEGQRSVGFEQRAFGLRQAPAGALERHARDVRQHHVSGPKLGRQPAVAGAQVEGALHPGQPLNELHELPGARLRVLRHQAPDVVVVPAHGPVATLAAPSMSRVLIVGAGLTGCTLAHRLAREGVESILLERAPVPGGLIRSEHMEGVLYEPHGSHIFHTEDTEVWELANYLYIDMDDCMRQALDTAEGEVLPALRRSEATAR